MTSPFRITLLAALCAAACACQPAGDDAAVETTTSLEDAGPVDATPADVGADDSDATITMRYDCDPDTTITVYSDDTARVALPDGQQVTLSRVTGSAPPVFSGDTLFFSIEDTGARLSQGDQANELTCNPA